MGQAVQTKIGSWSSNGDAAAIDLSTLSVGYPLLHLSRICGCSYHDMLVTHERWAKRLNMTDGWGDLLAPKWRRVLDLAFEVLTREGILRDPWHTPDHEPTVFPPSPVGVHITALGPNMKEAQC